jgi:tetratricopeptide (TPR) repeat protein
MLFGEQREMNVLVTYNDLPALPGSKILRRLDELYREPSEVNWNNPWHGMEDLKEFTGELTFVGRKLTVPASGILDDLYSLLNRRDVFADFTTKSSVAEEWGGPTGRCIGIWNFLRQMIITKELARRLASCNAEGNVRGFTTKILASLIIADRWFQNVQVRLVDTPVDTSSIPKTVSSLQKYKAEDFKRQGNEATRKKLHQLAVDLYTEALKIDPANVVYRNNRSGALYDSGRYREALDDAVVATKLDPMYAKAWARLGLAHLRLGRGKRAKEALQRAIELAGRNVTDAMRQGLQDANAKIEADMKAIDEEKNKEQARRLHVAFLDEDWDTTGRTVALHSRVHSRQTEGLILFAERMRWPYLNEVRDYAEAVYGDLVGGQVVSSHLHDWMYGMMLPGKWFAFKIMSALIICTRSICHTIGVAPYYECGVSLPQASYWRVRTPLGSVLGCLPGVISLNGWLGPCPPVRFVSSLDANKPRHIRLHARRVAPFTASWDWDDEPDWLQGEDVQYSAEWMEPGEEVEHYLAAMTDRDQWVIPEPPVQQVSVCEMKAIELQAVQSPTSVPAPALGVEMREQKMDLETEYRARIIFQMDDSEQTVAYSLYTNPIFVTLPTCRPGPRGNHEVHLREFSRYQNNIWTVEQLKEHSVDTADPDSVMIINATGQGGELLARAWCAERGKNAIVRRAGGPCFVCAVRAASRHRLGIGVVIWVS